MSNGTLTYTGVKQSFKFEDGSYVTTGQKAISDSIFKKVDAGEVIKNGQSIANYNYAVKDGAINNLWVNFIDPTEAATALAQINLCFDALIEE